jgi:hypothetical protein
MKLSATNYSSSRVRGRSMFKISRTRSWPPAIDLSTVRKTVAY